MAIANIVALAIASFVFVMTPGPGIVALLARTMAGGILPGFVLSLGLISGDFIYLIAVLASLHSISDIIAPYMVYVRLIGAGYLAYIGVMQMRAPAIQAEAGAISAATSRGMAQNYLTGVAISATNPKVVIFYLSFLPAFVDLATLRFADGVIVSVTVGAMLLLGCAIYIGGAHSLFRLIKNEAAAERVNQITGGLILAVAVTMVATL